MVLTLLTSVEYHVLNTKLRQGTFYVKTTKTMSTTSRLALFSFLILLLNLLIYFRAVDQETADQVYAECARNSGRIAAAINLAVLVSLGHFGLKKIYALKTNFQLFRLAVSLFAINHLVHFYFVSKNFKLQSMPLSILENFHGFLSFVLILVIPILLWFYQKLNKFIYLLLLTHFIKVTYFISITFYGRYKPVDPAYLHRLGIIIMVVAVFYVLYRAKKEQYLTSKTTDL